MFLVYQQSIEEIKMNYRSFKPSVLRTGLCLAVCFLGLFQFAHAQGRRERAKMKSNEVKSGSSLSLARTSSEVFSYRSGTTEENSLKFNFNPPAGAETSPLTLTIKRTNHEKSVDKLAVRELTIKGRGISYRFSSKVIPDCEGYERAYELGEDDVRNVLNTGSGLMVLVLEDGGGDEVARSNDFIYELRFGDHVYTYNPDGLTDQSFKCHSDDGAGGMH